jgi:AcrR family transcriptional regulator
MDRPFLSEQSLKRKPKRKEAILNAAKHLFAEKGFEATPTSEVAKQAGVAEGLIFHYFKTKEGILVYILEDMMDRYLEGIRRCMQDAATGLEAILASVRYHFDFDRRWTKEASVLIRDLPADLMKDDRPFRSVVAAPLKRLMGLTNESIARGKKDGSIRDLSQAETAFILRGLLNGLTRLRHLSPLAVPDLRDEAVDFCRYALAKTQCEEDDDDPESC